MSDTITVTISGPRGSGKSVLALVIETALLGAGLSGIQINDEGQKPVRTSPADRTARLRALSNRSTKVKIVTARPDVFAELLRPDQVYDEGPISDGGMDPRGAEG